VREPAAGFGCCKQIGERRVEGHRLLWDKRVAGPRDNEQACRGNYAFQKHAAVERPVVLVSDDEGKLRSVKDIVETKLVKRGVSLKALDYGKVEASAGSTVRQRAKIVQGIETEKAKAIVRAIKDAKLKVQASIQSDQVRVTGKNKDDLQKAIALIKSDDYGIPLQFTNYRG